MTEPSIDALACEDCPAKIHSTRGRGIGGPVLVVSVEHETSCPWLTRMAPKGATLSSSAGIVTHWSRDTRRHLRVVRDEGLI